MKICTAAEMRRYEQEAVDAGTSFEQLMENAGQGAAADILKRYPNAGRALIVCGKGNNGGDGLVIARVLQQHGWQADIVFLLGDEVSELAALNRSRLEHLPGIEFILPDKLKGRLKEHYDLIIEGIFGTGFSGDLPASVAQTCRLLNVSDGIKIALDIPTGLNGDTGEADKDAFKADLTYTFAAFKPGHFSPAGKELCGEIVCIDIV
ncbi:NAD(P)H-hydrate epimerase [Neisseria zoodegmatis]|uniref:NAD(P)H-hydrate epimerase n=1 Tax=Neisseria zoodegmatis TaxID=326523 RepID=A0AB38DR97_9NEIS|nr:NAD(P)H-hydrate epimerase [Neisseria zoodegmatis]OSI11530.1 NAD(P)H-hydrate epimerase [Neisseria zoodegmatis]SNU79920.1 Nicotinamide nucleotide repair protein [Neisseria zoodegmatis]